MTSRPAPPARGEPRANIGRGRPAVTCRCASRFLEPSVTAVLWGRGCLSSCPIRKSKYQRSQSFEGRTGVEGHLCPCPQSSRGPAFPPLGILFRAELQRPEQGPAWPGASPAPQAGGPRLAFPPQNKSPCSLRVSQKHDLLPINNLASMFLAARCRPQFRTVCCSAAGEGGCWGDEARQD